MRPVRIRQAFDPDLPALADSLGQERYFADQLARQRDGHGVLLVAWHAFTPVGDVYLWLGSAEEPELRARLPGVPLLTHLEVAPKSRGACIGTLLVGTAEQYLVARGHTRVALGVAPDNERVHRFYHRLGYVEWPYPPIWTSRDVYGPDGVVLREAERCLVFVKELRRAGAGGRR